MMNTTMVSVFLSIAVFCRVYEETKLIYFSRIKHITDGILSNIAKRNGKIANVIL